MLNRLYAHNHPRLWHAFLVWLTLTALLLSGCGFGQPRVYRVGILQGGGSFVEITDGFKKAMTDLGYIEGQNIVYIIQPARNDPEQDRVLLQRFVDEQVDVLFTFPTGSALLAREVTAGTTVPVIFAYAGIEGNHLVESVRQPGGNMTGVRFPGPEQVSKRLEILLEIAPQVERVWVGYDKNSTNAPPSLEALRQFAASQEVTLIEVPATTVEELTDDLDRRAKKDDLGFDAIILMPDGLNSNGVARFTKFAARHKIPLCGSNRDSVEGGALFGNGSNFFDVGMLAASLADKILKGTPAGSIPVVTPEQQLWINYNVARKLGLTVPEGLLKTADEVIR